MNEGVEVIELLELQGSADLVAKSELIESVRGLGCRISERNLTYYSSENLIPAAMRLGRRGVVYPRLAVSQLEFVIRCREAGQPIEAIKELLPLWRLLHRGVRDRSIDLSEFEFVARSHLTRKEANFAVPMLINHVMHRLCPDCRAEVSWTLKDGTTYAAHDGEPLTLAFVMAEMDEATHQGRAIAWTQLRLPGIYDTTGNEPTTIVLGIPNGVQLCNAQHDPHIHNRHAPGESEEVMA